MLLSQHTSKRHLHTASLASSLMAKTSVTTALTTIISKQQYKQMRTKLNVGSIVSIKSI